jgi:protein-S-isoprenylcysteine O-methyltransferase Ste14
MATVIVPAAICTSSGTNVGWGLPAPLAAASAGVGLALIVLGLRLIWRTIALFSRVGEGTLAPWDPTRKLVVSGPYLHVRNPMITGVFTVLSGETLVLGAPGMAIWTAVFAAVNAVYMPLFEEPGLVKRFGEDYVSYRRNVPRWLPRLKPWAPTFALALGLGLAVLAMAPAAAPARSQDAGAPAVASHDLAQSPSEVRDYWTRDRMRAAVPLDQPDSPSAALPPPASTSAQPPDVETDPALDTAYPQRLHGILFVSFGGANGACSATVVTARNRSVILTAGHCVVQPAIEGVSPPIWASNVLFVPGYRNGAAPLGSYAGTTGRASFAWVVSGDLTYDVGAYTLAPQAGVRVEAALGSRGVSFNRPLGTYKKKTRFQVFGYPAQPASVYDGQRLIGCNSRFQGFQFIFFAPVVRCSMKEGSSGGGWVLKGGLVNSVVSHNACGVDPNCAFVAGTYFGDAAFKLWSKAGGGIAKGRKKKIKGCKRKPKSKRSKCKMKAQRFKPLVR